MTGSEAWDIVAPILAMHHTNAKRMDLFDEVYITVYQALKEYDERCENDRGRES